MPITNITHSACYTVEMGVSAAYLTRITLDNIHTACKHICLQGIGCVCVKNYPPEIMQPSSSTRATIVSAENQNDATIVKATFFFCHYYIVWESNNAGEARGQSWNESLKSRWIPGGSYGYTSGTKRKHFAALSSPRPCWRWLQLQPSCGSPQCNWENRLNLRHTLGKIHLTSMLYDQCVCTIGSTVLLVTLDINSKNGAFINTSWRLYQHLTLFSTYTALKCVKFCSKVLLKSCSSASI